MAKRSRANRTEKATYQNIRNEHKYIDVVHHGDGHYYIIQYIKHELPERTVVNYIWGPDADTSRSSELEKGRC